MNRFKYQLKLLPKLCYLFSSLLIFFGGITNAQLPAKNGTQISQQKLVPFIKKYCIECHGPEEEEGGVNFREFPWLIQSNEQAQAWQDVLDVLNSGEMPPEDEPQPNQAEFTDIVSNLTQELQNAQLRLEESGGVYKIRRINKREYQNTIKHLFGLNIDPNLIPDDIIQEHHYDTAESLQYFDGPLLEQYIRIGGLIAKEGLSWAKEPFQKPSSKRIEPEKTANPKLSEKPIEKHPIDDDGVYMQKGGSTHRPVRSISIDHGKDPRASYILRVRGGVHDIATPQRHFMMVNESSVIRGQNTDVLGVLKISGTRKKPTTSEITVERNALGSNPKPKLTISEVMFEGITNISRWFPIYLELIGSDKKRPNVWIDWVELEGPYYQQESNVIHTLLVSDKDRLGDEENARQFLEKFAYEAFRHLPPNDTYLDKLHDYFKSRRQEGLKYQDAMGETLGLILASPNFLYLEEGKNEKQLDDHGFANRLSHFLWSAPPDEELYRVAEKLTDEKTLKTQILRMLNDKKAESFFEGFMSQWASLERLEAITPEWQKFTAFNQGIRYSMYQESIAFFKTMVLENLNVYYLIDSNFVTINSQLAHYYGFPPINETNEFVKVAIPPNHPRGGLMTQGAFLTIGSVGERTSPVIRGSLILEKLLNDPPASPPPNVPELTEASEKPLSNRELVELHRSQKVCASCHDKIDPIGYSLENFDAIGLWRETETVDGKEFPINTQSFLENGKKLTTLRDLQQHIKSQDDQLTTYMIESLLSYAIGRQVEFSEAQDIQNQVNEVISNRAGMTDLIFHVVNSKTFRGK